MENKFYSVRWYEPLASSKDEQVSIPSRVGLPKGRGWHEQETSKEEVAIGLASALRAKGFSLVETRCFRVTPEGLRIDA